MLSTLTERSLSITLKRPTKMNAPVKKGDRIRIIWMDDNNGKDWQVTQMIGKTYTVDFIDSIGQIHLEGKGIAVIPELDKYELL